MRRRFLPSIAALIALSATPSESRLPELTVTELWATKGSLEHLFGSITGMGETINGDIWVSDQLGRVVVALDPEGGNLRIVAEEGDGPGEVRGPGRMTHLPAGGIALHDVVRSSIEIFHESGEFAQRIQLTTQVVNPKGFTVMNTGEFVLSGGVSDGQSSIHVFSADGGVRRAFHDAPRTRNPRAGIMIAGGPVTSLEHGQLVFSQAAPHAIYLYDGRGGTGRRIASDPDLIPAIGDDFIQEQGSGADLRRSFKWFFPQSKAVFRMSDGVLLNVVVLYEEDASIWELYSASGTLLSRSLIRRAYEPWLMTSDGDVLASYRDKATDEPLATRLKIAPGG